MAARSDLSSFRYLLFVLASIGLPLASLAPAAAYSLKTHEQLTRAAMAQLNACRGALSPKEGVALAAQGVWGDSAIEALVSCNLGQDRLTKKFTVWHFYSPTRVPKGRWTQANFVAAETRLDHWFSILVAALGKDETTPAQAWGLTGAIIHYLQDVTTPPHVIPVFHPSPVWNGDNFDDFPFEDEAPSTDVTYCRGLLEGRVDLPTLLAATAAATKESLSSPLTWQVVRGSLEDVPPDWSLFWNQAVDEDGFGSYGCVGDKFGEERVGCKGTKIRILPETYTAFARARHKAALEASVQAVVFTQRVLGSAPKGDTVTCPLPQRTHDEEHVQIQWMKDKPVRSK